MLSEPQSDDSDPMGLYVSAKSNFHDLISEKDLKLLLLLEPPVVIVAPVSSEIK